MPASLPSWRHLTSVLTLCKAARTTPLLGYSRNRYAILDARVMSGVTFKTPKESLQRILRMFPELL